MNLRDVIPTAENSSNFDVVPESITEVGTTLENLKAAVCGETGASAKYAACAAAAKEQGFDQIARLFEATSAAEQIHIGLEAGVIAEIEPGYERPAAPEAEGIATDLNLIAGALGEIYETSDMYPSFIKVAQEEGNKKAEFVFTRAKLAEAVHAELYMDAYNNIDAPTDEAYYLCPICGYIHKGDDFEKCPDLLHPGRQVPQVLVSFARPDGQAKEPTLRGPVAFHLRPCFGHGAYRSTLGPKAGESGT